MTDTRGIAGVSRALRTLVAHACAPEGVGVPVQLLQPADLPNLLGDGVALVLLQAELAAALRSATPPRGTGSAPKPGATPLELLYLLVPHAQEPERQQRLLGLLFQALAATPILDGTRLNEAAGEPGLFKPAEEIQILIDPPGEASGLATLPPALRLRVRGLVIDPPSVGTPPVITRIVPPR